MKKQFSSNRKLKYLLIKQKKLNLKSQYATFTNQCNENF